MIINLTPLVVILIWSLFLTGRVRRYAIQNHLIDSPNERSSHSVPIPRGGGLAIVVTFLLSLVGFVIVGALDLGVLLAFAGGGALVAIIGYIDDRHDVPASIRFPIHFVAAIWATAWIGGIPTLYLGFATLNWGWFGHIVSILGIVWLLNLYNFMDGIDGLSGSEAVFVAGIGGILLIADGVDSIGWSALALAAASAGFLFWNWPKAKIFMGDVGSGFLGYTFGVFIIIGANQSGVIIWVWLLLLSVFIVDATVTLLRRLLRGEKVYEAHRSHAYQHATTIFNSHLRVTLGVTGINVLFLAPLALIAWNWPKLALAPLGIALSLLSVLALQFNAGVESLQESKPASSFKKGAESKSVSPQQ